MRVIISGGGTGGHVYPAIAIANELKRKFENLDILFVGAEGKLEMEKVPAAGYKIEGLWISGFQRSNMMRNLSLPFKLISSLWKARRIVKSFHPDIAIGVGGYASGPLLKMAQKLGVPTLIQEQNSFPGKTNLLLAKDVDKICVAYPNMERFFPKEKIVITGNPVRRDLMEIDQKRNIAIEHFGLSGNKKVLFVFGGSLGARSINEAIHANADFIESKEDVEIIWQVGKLYWDEFKDSRVAQMPHVKAMTFVERMDYAYAVADLILCRAGALTISELCVAGKAAILVPSPNVAEDHQTQNAKSLSDLDAAIMTNDNSIAKDLEMLVDNNMYNENKLNELKININRLSKPNAVNEIVKIISEIIK